MSKGAETRQTIIERAAPLFNQRGFYGCSLSDIMSATGLQKGGIYRHFSSKEELAEAVFQFSAAAAVKTRSATVGEGATPLSTLRSHIQHFVETPSPVPGGCPLLNAAIDADDGNETLRKLVQEAFRSWKARLSALLEAAMALGEVTKHTDPQWVADTIICALEGAVMLSRLQRSKAPLLHARRTLDLVLDSIAVDRSSVPASETAPAPKRKAKPLPRSGSGA